MIPRDTLRKIRRIEIRTRRSVHDVFAGRYHSVFKGRGMEFQEVREYVPGDDIRSIDWNVTARTGAPHVKKFTEERELTVMLLVDISASNRFGSTPQLKRDLAAEIAAVLAFSAIANHDRVGLILFTDRVEKHIPPRKGPTHVLRVISEILAARPASPPPLGWFGPDDNRLFDPFGENRLYKLCSGTSGPPSERAGSGADLIQYERNWELTPGGQPG